MADRLIGVRAKVERANKHIDDLDSALRSFYATDPYPIETERNPQTGQQVHRLKNAAPVPHSIALIAGDTIHNLRSALDHLACQLVQVGSSQDRCSRDIAFPISLDSAKYDEAIQRKIKGATEDVKKAIRAVQAYKGGNGHQLWMLSEFDNADKHRLLLTFAHRYEAINLGAYVPPGLQHATLIEGGVSRALPAPIHPMLDYNFPLKTKLCPLEAGDILFTGIPNAEMNYNVKPTVEVAFAESDVGEAEPILPFLHQLVDFVSGIVLTFEPFL